MKHTAEYLVAYDETIKMWVVFYNQDRPDSLGERDFETGETLSPIMCDQITVAQCPSKEVAESIVKSEERLKALETGLQHLVNAIPGDGTWNYQAAMENARRLLNPIK